MRFIVRPNPPHEDPKAKDEQFDLAVDAINFRSFLLRDRFPNAVVMDSEGNRFTDA